MCMKKEFVHIDIFSHIMELHATKFSYHMTFSTNLRNEIWRKRFGEALSF